MTNNTFYMCSKFQCKRVKKPIFFFHVPKCAGTTISVLLSWLINSQTRIPGPLFEQNDKGGETAFQKFNSAKSYKLYNNFDFIYGHLPYEVTDFLEKSFLKITLLRDPIKRAYSHYNWMLDRGYCSISDSITDIFQNQRITPNTITNQFSGYGYKQKNSDKSLISAYENLSKNIDLVYDSDGIFDLLKLLISSYELPNLFFQNQQESMYKNKKDNKNIISVIKNNNNLDIELFNELKKKKIFKKKNTYKKKVENSKFLFSSPHLKVKNKNNIILESNMLKVLKNNLLNNNFKIIEK